MSSSDVVIQPSGSMDFNKPPQRLLPTYLITVEDGKKDIFFIATKLEQSGFNEAVKCIGFYCSISLETVVSTYDELIKTTEASSFVEMLLPWKRIKSVRSLTYKHKTK